MTDDWKKFLSGHWTREMPKREGKFPTADYMGRQSDPVIVYKSKGKYHCIPVWEGWYWSEPFPSLPPTPEWKP